MADKISRARRSDNMRAVRSKDMAPELVVRRLVHGLGYRYRLHKRELPGKPYLAFGPRNKVIFVHGCFWHQHKKSACLDGRLPKSNIDYWKPKLRSNTDRDAENLRRLKELGWKALVIWECETKDIDGLKETITSFLDGGH